MSLPAAISSNSKTYLSITHFKEKYRIWGIDGILEMVANIGEFSDSRHMSDRFVHLRYSNTPHKSTSAYNSLITCLLQDILSAYMGTECTFDKYVNVLWSGSPKLRLAWRTRCLSCFAIYMWRKCEVGTGGVFEVTDIPENLQLCPGNKYFPLRFCAPGTVFWPLRVLAVKYLPSQREWQRAAHSRLQNKTPKSNNSGRSA